MASDPAVHQSPDGEASGLPVTMDATTSIPEEVRAEELAEMDRRFAAAVSNLRLQHAQAKAAMMGKEDYAWLRNRLRKKVIHREGRLPLAGGIPEKYVKELAKEGLNVESEKEFPAMTKGVSFAKEAEVLGDSDPPITKDPTHPQPVPQSQPAKRRMGWKYNLYETGQGSGVEKEVEGIPTSKNGFQGLDDWDENERGSKIGEGVREEEQHDKDQEEGIEVVVEEESEDSEGEEEGEDVKEAEKDPDYEGSGAEVSLSVSEGSSTEQLAIKAEMEMDMAKDLTQLNLSPKKPPDKPPGKPPEKPTGKQKQQKQQEKSKRVTRSQSKGDPIGGGAPLGGNGGQSNLETYSGDFSLKTAKKVLRIQEGFIHRDGSLSADLARMVVIEEPVVDALDPL
nr:hypothetical protein Itr_chr02CG27040 [Ipomoea trifida]